MTPFRYPKQSHRRRHGPVGYQHYESFRPWLRDEFSFTCVYCLKRERWGHQSANYHLDHFQPQTLHPESGNQYENLYYACVRCNLVKRGQSVPDPAIYLTEEHVEIFPSGEIRGRSPEAVELIWKLDLDSPEAREWRLIWMRNVELAEAHDRDQFVRLMGYPDDLPNLGTLRPPGGNTRPLGIQDSYYAQQQAGNLSETY